MTPRRLLPVASAPGADLPVRPALDEVIAAAHDSGTAVLVAPPGSGKTSLLPLALADAFDGRVVVAEPRRLATRAAAHRLAALVGESPGESVGYAMRGERVGGRATRVEVVTTGLLVQRLQRDPDLPGVAALLIDECHERHLDADLALAFGVDVRATLRPDLALVATSATPDIAALTAALSAGGGATPVVSAATRSYDVEIVWAPPPVSTPLLPGSRVDRRLLTHVAGLARRALAETAGNVLVFVPGEAEVAAVVAALGDAGEVLPLYGRQSRAEQQRVFAPSSRRRVIVTTAVAESSLTVPGVRTVVDSGLARQPRLDPARGLTALVTTRVSRASADQRAGRAGREGPGRVYRSWSETDHAHLTAQTAPEIATTDLAGFALAVAAWGAPSGAGLALLDAPPAAALDAAVTLLRDLEAVDGMGRITERGRRLAAVGIHPRLARALLDGAALVGAQRATETVALLSDDSPSGRGDDLPARLRELHAGRDRAAAARWREEMRRLERAVDHRPKAPGRMDDDQAVGTVVGLAYPDRLARARQGDSPSYLTSGGTGAALADGSGLRGSPWLAVATADRPPGRTEARIRAAAPIDEATARLVAPDLVRTRDEVAWDGGGLVARRVESLGALTLSEAPLRDPDPTLVLAAVRDGLARTGLQVLTWTDRAVSLRRRMAFCRAHLGDPWPPVDEAALLTAADSWLGPDLARVRRSRDLARIDVTTALRRLLPWPAATRFDELAPERIVVPSGSRVTVAYDGAEPPVVAVKLQETFGWTTTPALADGRAPVVLHLLSPAGRTVAVTADLASFWRQGYPQVRAELRARYPKHPWPEDPLATQPTARTQRRSRTGQ
ncbi:ATP-dependent helicase HrpB [uncultured Jatrophihabitans sp.]|uniref:ATP-dependent helicase HrpB n=1 Tax=uncultured Jatrophihabitans sp. TaxID=1610747 RepID=UPI0035CC2248